MCTRHTSTHAKAMVRDRGIASASTKMECPDVLAGVHGTSVASERLCNHALKHTRVLLEYQIHLGRAHALLYGFYLLAVRIGCSITIHSCGISKPACPPASHQPVCLPIIPACLSANLPTCVPACPSFPPAVKPRKGDALLFFSLNPNALPDEMSLHTGCPVIEGAVALRRLKTSLVSCVRARTSDTSHTFSSIRGQTAHAPSSSCTCILAAPSSRVRPLL